MVKMKQIWISRFSSLTDYGNPYHALKWEDDICAPIEIISFDLNFFYYEANVISLKYELTASKLIVIHMVP